MKEALYDTPEKRQRASISEYPEPKRRHDESLNQLVDRIAKQKGYERCLKSVAAPLESRLRSLEEERRWIPVEERLPEPNGRTVEGWGAGWSDCDKVYYGNADDFDPANMVEEDRISDILWRWPDGTPIRDQSVTYWRNRPLPPNPPQP